MIASGGRATTEGKASAGREVAIAASPVRATGIAVKVRGGKTTGETSEAKARPG